MILIILTEQGLQQAGEALAEADQVWLNPGLLTDATRPLFSTLKASCHELPDYFDAHKDKSLVAALTYVEGHTNDPDILIECP